MQEVQQVVGILPGGVEADDEVNRAMALGDLFEACAELGLASCGFDELEFAGSALEVRAQEGGVVPVA